MNSAIDRLTEQLAEHAAQRKGAWTLRESVAVCGLWWYFTDAATDGRKVNKAAAIRHMRREDGGPLAARKRTSIECKLMNVSAAAEAIGLAACPGYKPAPCRAALLDLILQPCGLIALAVRRELDEVTA